MLTTTGFEENSVTNALLIRLVALEGLQNVTVTHFSRWAWTE